MPGWKVHGERSLYESEWVSLTLVDVEPPDGSRFEHHVVRPAQPAAGVVIHDPERGILLLWRHRFITDTWGWEIPAGRLDPGEDAANAAAREALEETGWQPGALTHLCTYQPLNGMSDMQFHLFLADGAEHVGPPEDVNEADRIEWVPVDNVRALIRSGEVNEGMSITALLWVLTFCDIS